MQRKDQAYTYLKTKIINNEIPQGTPIREVDLAESLKMSRTPIREALRDLSAEGLIVTYPSRGTFVSTLTADDVEEIYELRTLCETWALEKGFSKISQRDLDNVETAFRKAAVNFDWKIQHQVDQAFHQMIIERSGSQRLAGFVNILNTQIERIRRISAKDPERAEKTLQEHLKIIDNIRSGDVAASKDALQEHLRLVANSAIESCRVFKATQTSTSLDTIDSLLKSLT